MERRHDHDHGMKGNNAMTNRFAGFADNGGVPKDGYAPAVARTEKPKNPTPAVARTAKPLKPVTEDGDGEDVFSVRVKKGNNNMNEIDRGPYYKRTLL
jgi:hypothetical protein